MTGLCSDTVAAYNAERKQVLARRKQVNRELKILFGVLAFMTLLAGLLLTQMVNAEFAVTVVGTVGLIGFAWLYQFLRKRADAPRRAMQARMRESVFPAMFHEIENLHFQPSPTGFIDEIPDVVRPKAVVEMFRITPPKLRYEYGDLIEGSYQGRAIALCEVEVSQRVRSGRYSQIVTIFEGVAIKFALAHPVPSISIARKGGALSPLAKMVKDVGPLLGRGKGKRSRPLDPSRDVQCDMPSFAETVFDEEGVRRFSLLESTHARGDMRFAAENATGYVVIETDKDHFELPPLNKPLDPVVDVRRLRGEMSGFLQLISDLREMLEFDAERAQQRDVQSA